MVYHSILRTYEFKAWHCDSWLFRHLERYQLGCIQLVSVQFKMYGITSNSIEKLCLKKNWGIGCEISQGPFLFKKDGHCCSVWIQNNCVMDEECTLNVVNVK